MTWGSHQNYLLIVLHVRIIGIVGAHWVYTTIIEGVFLAVLYTKLKSSFPGSTAQLRPWPPPQNPAEFLGGFSTIFFFTG
jgi:hypothetical protein